MSTLTNPKAIIFDLLTALLDSWSLWNAAAGDEATGRLWRERYLEVTFGCGKYRPYDELIEESARNIEGLSRDAPSKLLNSWSQLQPWPDSKATLERLKERGYFIAVVTNCSRERGYIAISRCGVQFDAVITAEESGYYKPHPKAYLAILEKLGIANPADALFVAGSNGDVVGAAAVGMGTVWHNRVGLPMLPGSVPYVVGRSLRKTLQSLLGYAGLERSEISTPTLYMNRRKFVTNCQRMQAKAKSLDASFRVHIKTHKTREGTLEQVRGGEGHIVVSSLKEIEWMEPLVKTGAISTILYGVPPAKSYIPRLSLLKQRIKAEILVMLDHPSQIELLHEATPDEKWSVFIKIDCGTHRAGLEPQSTLLSELIQAALHSKNILIFGFYCHSGHSYSSRTLHEAEDHLLNEINSATTAAKQCLQLKPNLDLIVSVGATPTAHAASAKITKEIETLPLKLELHAGNYPVLDIQQVDTNLVSLDDVSSFIEAEVCSVYPERQEVLINIGTLGLGREPGLEPNVWGRAKILDANGNGSKSDYSWNIVRQSQEHGILAPRVSIEAERTELVSNVAVGSRVRIIPQHACIAGAMHSSYAVVDDDDDGMCVDEWVRCRGW